ncbi:serine hydrolase domain-containing protein [Blastopirellula marina]|uniref:Beta-lactamase-related domain-containing protein n=1 Tax=Blastopirellula marina TaxID=124 RepID=A0A2S8G9T5_9BACT|nr:serine hydrolase [Blastopirellula marina]PQO41070.1 hypothetical protein C5Y98_03675 [Blastopirellula marina]PTL45946.1 hypothetical protein C5Y97_03675 [Blastopirellula marina]
MSRLLAFVIALSGWFVAPLWAAEIDFPQAPPRTQGIQAKRLREMSQWVRAEQHDVRAMLVVRRGKLVFEWYAAGVTRDHNHNVFSVTKSVVATLAGAAIQQGKLSGVDVTLAELFPDAKYLAKDPIKANITLGQLLSMQAGLPVTRGNKPKQDPQRILFDRVHSAADRGRFVLRLPLESKPGEKFIYNNNEPQLVASALQQAYGTDIRQIGHQLLFDPLKFQNVGWLFPDQTGQYPGGYGLRLRAIDMAKLGQLYLQQGTWNSEAILSEPWCQKATSDQTGTGYGYFWWNAPGSDGQQPFSAKGVRGQRIYVDPQKELIFVVASDLPPEQVNPVMHQLIDQFVIPSVESPMALAEDAEESQLLKAELAQAARFLSPHRNGLPATRLPQPR